LAYWEKCKPALDYGVLFLIATVVGATISSALSRDFKIESVPPLWRERFGGRVSPRMLVAFFAGFVLLFGARLAGGRPDALRRETSCEGLAIDRPEHRWHAWSTATILILAILVLIFGLAQWKS
jgi:hypothetical protein